MKMKPYTGHKMEGEGVWRNSTSGSSFWSSWLLVGGGWPPLSDGILSWDPVKLVVLVVAGEDPGEDGLTENSLGDFQRGEWGM